VTSLSKPLPAMPEPQQPDDELCRPTLAGLAGIHRQAPPADLESRIARAVFLGRRRRVVAVVPTIALVLVCAAVAFLGLAFHQGVIGDAGSGPVGTAPAGSSSTGWDGPYAVSQVTVTCPGADAGTIPSTRGLIPPSVTVTHNRIDGVPISVSGQVPYTYSTGNRGLGFTISGESDGTYSFRATAQGGAWFAAQGIIIVATDTQNHYAGGSPSSLTCPISFLGIRKGTPATALPQVGSSSFPSTLVGGGAGLLVVLLLLAAVLLRGRAPHPVPVLPSTDPAAVPALPARNPTAAMPGAMNGRGYLWEHGDVVALAQPSATQMSSHLRVRVALLPILLAAATDFGLSLLLPWHNRIVYVTQTYVPVRGMDDETWVAAGSILAIVLAGLFVRRRPGVAAKLVAIFADAVMLACLAIDYVDWRMYAAAVNPNVPSLMYLGPGFYLACGGTLLLIASTVLAWRHL
jgi:hypothetical protein